MSDLIRRRELLKLASAALLGITTAGKNHAMPRELTESIAEANNWKPLFLSAQQDETVMALAEAIIPETDTPGARAAQVHRYVDLFLTVQSPAEQKQFVDGLKSLDGLANQTHGRNFADCSTTQQNALVLRIAGTDFFRVAKHMTSSIYYATPEGNKELMKAGPAPNGFGCEHMTHV